MSKLRVYLLGVLTLLMVPLAWLLQWLPPLSDFFRLDELCSWWTLIGVEFGCIYGLFMVIVTSSESATQSFQQQIRLVQSFRLTVVDALFLSLCAGLGEEFLFRIALQEWLHPLLTAVIFVAIHGYIQPKDWEVTKYGLLVLGFIIVLSYAVSTQGIWFCIAAHATYDFVLFRYWTRYRSLD